jgi:APA family basic amino acid/polyamine antiporter
MGFSLGIFPLLSVTGLFKARRLKLSPYRLPGFPLVPIFYVLAGASILALGFFERPVESGIALVMVVAGIPVYYAFRKSL